LVSDSEKFVLFKVNVFIDVLKYPNLDKQFEAKRESRITGEPKKKEQSRKDENTKKKG
jgi:hypothetical protein